MEEKPLVIGGKSYISSKRAAVLFDYTTDYIGQLSRSKRIGSVMVGRDRFIDYASLVNYVDTVSNPGTPQIVAKSPASGFTSTPAMPEVYTGAGLNAGVSKRAASIWATSAVATIGLLMFFGLSSLGQGVIRELGSSFSNETRTTASAISSSPVVTANAASFLSEVDDVYLGFLEDVERAIAKLWRASTGKIIALIKPFAGVGKTETIIVQNSASTTTAPVVQIPEARQGDSSEFVGLTEAQVRMIAKELINAELARSIDYSSRAAGSNLGLVVKPGTKDAVSDAAIVEGVKNSFSDEVRVTIDQSRSSGVVRPVFRNPTDDYYNFILVPVDTN